MSGPIRVVIADDEHDLRLLLRLQLRRMPEFEIVGEAVEGAEAVRCALEADADAVIMDLLMPGTSGFEAIATLQEEAPDIGLVAYTAVAGDFVRSEMARLGVELVLKSGDIGPLAAALVRAARSRRGAAGG